jgi:tetrahydromethanopterin S-methyltransferase subunit H
MAVELVERPLPKPSSEGYIEARLLEALGEAGLALEYLTNSRVAKHHRVIEKPALNTVYAPALQWVTASSHKHNASKHKRIYPPTTERLCVISSWSWLKHTKTFKTRHMALLKGLRLTLRSTGPKWVAEENTRRIVGKPHTYNGFW